ncbi:hypothetical protein O6H91_07G058800 [Diphasiastrum complanatum]|uniref:Uncharacterized protein n=1 Tax=Diphasiastrum complanatum TaxID=34168 RepID=A0ACC2D5Y5_DIPCM|nr:hypothetical protein O6H91_Y431500 [Diphasiastrum complanatum]KAJ7549564.1 hypothetical protein O6H91_07G058800 [Diphasiastrum complanatum]
MAIGLRFWIGGSASIHVAALLESKPRERLNTSIKLKNGLLMPAIGYGTGLRFTRDETRTRDELKEAILSAIQLGYRTFDTASSYGTEAALGDALSDAFQQGLVTRSEVFVTSKLACDNYDPDDVLPALQRSLRSLQLEYLDLYLVHFPLKLRRGAIFPPKEKDILPAWEMKGTWKALERCVDIGVTKDIGVSNFTVKKLEQLLDFARISPVVDQVELHPIWQQRQLREYCKKKNIHVSAWSPLGGPGKPWGSYRVLEHPIIKRIAEKHGKTPAQVTLRWIMEIGVSAMVRTLTPGRMLENISIFDFALTEEDHAEISTIEQKRLALFEYLCNQTTSPYETVEDLWDGEL